MAFIYVLGIRMLRWMYSHIKKDKIQNNCIQGDICKTLVEDKMTENWLKLV